MNTYTICFRILNSNKTGNCDVKAESKEDACKIWKKHNPYNMILGVYEKDFAAGRATGKSEAMARLKGLDL